EEHCRHAPVLAERGQATLPDLFFSEISVQRTGLEGWLAPASNCFTHSGIGRHQQHIHTVLLQSTTHRDDCCRWSTRTFSNRWYDVKNSHYDVTRLISHHCASTYND